jgi:hypothetical protein
MRRSVPAHNQFMNNTLSAPKETKTATCAWCGVVAPINKMYELEEGSDEALCSECFDGFGLAWRRGRDAQIEKKRTAMLRSDLKEGK